MEFMYKKAIEENKLKVSQLPEDAQTGIKEIESVLKSFAMLEKRGIKPTENSMKKLKSLDKWVYYEILDFLEDTDENDDDMPFDRDDFKELNDGKNKPKTSKNEEEEEEEDDDDDEEEEDDDFGNEQLGIEIEQELEQMFASGKTTWGIEEVRASAKKTYNVIWDNHDESGENGVETTKYLLVETSPEVYTLTQK